MAVEHAVKLVANSVCRSQPLPAGRQQQEPCDPSSGAGVSQGGLVPRRRDCCPHRRRPHPGAAHHAGVANAAQREQAAAGPAAADAVPAPLQLPRPPHQEGPRGQAWPGVHGARDGPRELLPDLWQDEAGGPGQRQDPVSGALGNVQRPRQAGVCMIPAGLSPPHKQPGLRLMLFHFRRHSHLFRPLDFWVCFFVFVFFLNQWQKKYETDLMPCGFC